MKQEEIAAAVDGLIGWLRSQDLLPARAMPVLAQAMVTAAMSLCPKQPDGSCSTADALVVVYEAANMVWEQAGLMAKEQEERGRIFNAMQGKN